MIRKPIGLKHCRAAHKSDLPHFRCSAEGGKLDIFDTLKG
jgi:hypothetical protein